MPDWLAVGAVLFLLGMQGFDLGATVVALHRSPVVGPPPWRWARQALPLFMVIRNVAAGLLTWLGWWLWMLLGDGVIVAMIGLGVGFGWMGWLNWKQAHEV